MARPTHWGPSAWCQGQGLINLMRKLTYLGRPIFWARTTLTTFPRWPSAQDRCSWPPGSVSVLGSEPGFLFRPISGGWSMASNPGTFRGEIWFWWIGILCRRCRLGFWKAESEKLASSFLTLGRVAESSRAPIKLVVETKALFLIFHCSDTSTVFTRRHV